MAMRALPALLRTFDFAGQGQGTPARPTRLDTAILLASLS